MCGQCSFADSKAFLLSVAVMVLLFKKDEKDRAFHGAYLIYMFVSLLLLCISGRGYPHYGMVLVPVVTYPIAAAMGAMDRVEKNDTITVIKALMVVYLMGAVVLPDWVGLVQNVPYQYVTFNRYTNSPVANYRGEIYSLPFNMYTFNKMWGVTTPEEAQKRIALQRTEIEGEPENLEEQAISLVGRDVYEKLVKGYTEKQWGRDCRELPPFIIKRLPVRFTYDNNYFNALYQGIPMVGYTKLVERLLEGIEVQLNTDYLKNREKFQRLAEQVVYTGAIDEFYDYRLGCLEYRSVRFENVLLDMPNFQGNAVVNYTDRETPWTRIIEHKWFTFGKNEDGIENPKTVISREYSSEWKQGDEPYYPVNDEKNSSLYEAYRTLADKEERVIFGGRLGDYKYYDMDAVVEAALEAVERYVN